MSLIDSAERLYEKGDYSGSLEIVLKLLENEPDDLKALELKAVLLYVENLLPESIRTYKRLLRFYGGNDEVWKQLSALRSISNAFRLLRSYDNAIIYCEKSIAICEHFLKIDRLQKNDFIDQLIEELWVLGEYQRKTRKYSRAIDTYKKMVRLLSEFGCLETIAEALYELACAYYDLNRTTEALSKFSEVLKLHESSEETSYSLSYKGKAHYYVGSIHFAARDFKKAIFHLDESVFHTEKIYEENNDVEIEDDFLYRRAKRLQNTLKKNKFLWKKRK